MSHTSIFDWIKHYAQLIWEQIRDRPQILFGYKDGVTHEITNYETVAIKSFMTYKSEKTLEEKGAGILLEQSPP